MDILINLKVSRQYKIIKKKKKLTVYEIFKNQIEPL